MTDQKPTLTKTELEALKAEWDYLISRLRAIAEKLGYSDPFPTRKERRQSGKIDQSDA